MQDIDKKMKAIECFVFGTGLVTVFTTVLTLFAKNTGSCLERGVAAAFIIFIGVPVAFVAHDSFATWLRISWINDEDKADNIAAAYLLLLGGLLICAIGFTDIVNRMIGTS